MFLFLFFVSINAHFVPTKTDLAVKVIINLFPADSKNTSNKFIIYNFV